MAALRRNQDHFRIFRLTERPGCASLGMVAYVLPEGMSSRGGVQYPFPRRGLRRKVLASRQASHPANLSAFPTRQTEKHKIQ